MLEESGEKGHIRYPLFFGMSLAVVLLFAGIGVASATDYYVATWGSDSISGTSVGSPWQHPSYAAKQAEAGDTIYLMDGTWYDEHVEFANSGTEGNPITMKVYPGSTPILDGVTGTGTGIKIYRHDYINLNGLTLKNYGSGIYLRELSNSHVLNCKVYTNYALAGEASGIGIFYGCHHCSIKDCLVDGDAWNSIQIGGRVYGADGPVWSHEVSDDITVSGCTVCNNSLHNLIDFFGIVRDIHIINNTLYNGWAGTIYSHQGFPDHIYIKDNKIYGSSNGIHFDTGTKDSVIENNTIYDINPSSGHSILIRTGKTYGDTTFYSTNNIIKDNYCRGDVYYEMISVASDDYLIEHNDVHSDSGDTEYRVFGGSGGTIRNAVGTRYKVRADNTAVTVEYTDGRTFSVDGSGEYTTYTITSGTHTIEVIGEDTTPPTASNGQPTGTISGNTPTLSVTSNEPATCKGSIDTDETYKNMDFTFTGTRTFHSYDVITLLSDDSHTVYIRCKDIAGNTATSSYSWCFTVETPTPDTTPPSAVNDLATSNPTSNSIELTWTAPGDEGNSGTASQYDIRYSTSEITESNWNSATQYTGEPTPQVAGSTETFTVTGLSPNITYYFVLKTSDEVPNWSDISNCASGATTEETHLYLWLEAENADIITPDFEIANDASASNGKYLWVPEGAGWNLRKGEATYTIHINTPGDYVIWGKTFSALSSDNSFFIQIDDDFEALWAIALSENWLWDAVNHWGSGEEFNPEIDPVVFTLSVGNHILKIKQREDGTKLDKLLITNNMSYVPIDDIEDATPPTTTSVITPAPNEAGWNTVIQVVVTFFRSDTGGAGVSYTNYSKTPETGPWTTVNINAAMGPDAENVTDIGEDKFNVTVSDEGVTTIWYYTVNNNATSEPIKNVTVKIDTTPPASISNLQSTTDTTWINWTWTNPTDEDFNHTMVYLDGIFKTNTSNPYYNATGLSPDTSYEIGTHTVDTNGNVNSTWVNQTTKTVNNLIPRYDVNEDGAVDILDTTIVGQHFGETTSPPYPRYDVNDGGTVDILDTTIVGQHFGEIMR